MWEGNLSRIVDRSESPVGFNLLKNNFKIRQKVAGDETDLRRR